MRFEKISSKLPRAMGSCWQYLDKILPSKMRRKVPSFLGIMKMFDVNLHGLFVGASTPAAQYSSMSFCAGFLYANGIGTYLHKGSAGWECSEARKR